MKLRGLIVAGVVALAALAASSAAMAGTPTSARIYQAFTSSGNPAIRVTKTVIGSCFSGSIQADRRDAWRCSSHNLIYDPCFSSSNTTGTVLCPAAAWKRSGVDIGLTKPLPYKFNAGRAPSTDGPPWAMQTASSANCVMEGMGPVSSNRVFGRYACTNGKWLWGRLNRNARPWTMYIAPLTATKLTSLARIKIAWY